MARLQVFTPFGGQARVPRALIRARRNASYLTVQRTAGKGLEGDRRGKHKVKIAKGSALFHAVDGLDLAVGSGLVILPGSRNALQMKQSKQFRLGDDGEPEVVVSVSEVVNDTDDTELQGETLADILSESGRLMHRGPTPPNFKRHGRLHFNTTAGDLFYWDEVRNKWLAVRTIELEGSTMVAIVSTYLQLGAMIMTATRGWVMATDMTLCEMQAAKVSVVGDPVFELHDDGVAAATFQIGAANETGSSLNLNVDVAAASIVTMFQNGGLVTPGSMMRAVLRRRL